MSAGIGTVVANVGIVVVTIVDIVVLFLCYGCNCCPCVVLRPCCATATLMVLLGSKVVGLLFFVMTVVVLPVLLVLFS